MGVFRYYRPSGRPGPAPGVFVAVAPENCRDVKALMLGLADSLRFPGYSGGNFDAFWDSVRTLEGTGERKVVLVHRDIPPLDDDALEIYIGLLRDAVLYWRRHAADHVFEVWFPLAGKTRIAALLRRASRPGNGG